MDRRSRKRLALMARVLATAALLPFILNKIQRQEMWADRFAAWGYPRWGALATTIVEVAAVMGLWIPGATKYAIGALTIVLLGACYTWLVNGPAATAGIPFAVLVLVAMLGLAERYARKVSA